MKPDKPTSKERIEHILKAIDLIASYSDNMDFNHFSKDEKSYFACLYQYTVIGEAVVNIEFEILEKYKYPWHKVKSFRNFILHEYHAIDARVVRDTSKIVLPGLKELALTILKNEFK